MSAQAPRSLVIKLDGSGAARGGAGAWTPTLDMQRDAARRLSILCATVVVLSLSLLVLAVALGAWSIPLGPADHVVGPAFLLLTVALGVSARAGWPRPAVILDIGHIYQVLTGLYLGLLVNRAPWPDQGGLLSWSPVAVWALVYPIVVPSAPHRSLAMNALTVAMDPVSLLILMSFGKPAPAFALAAARFLPGIGSVVLAHVATTVVHGLGRQVARAQETGAYELVRRLGAGSYGEVWLARHRMLRRPAAVKLVSAQGAAGGQDIDGRTLLRRFEREAQATSQLGSPNTVQLYDFGITQDGTFYYAMELLRGMDLQRLVERHGPLPPDRVVRILLQACHSLHDAHVRGLIHRDVKPANIFVCKQGFEYEFVKVLDFGLVRSRSPDQVKETRLTADGAINGTPAYMSPETILGEAEIDGRADLYSLGCVAYWMLTGTLVFDEQVPLQMVVAHARATPEAPSQRLGAPIPYELEALVLRCLSKKAKDRPSSAWAMREELERMQQGALGSWTQSRAQAWWSEHMPEVDQVDASDDEGRDLR